jgi:regulator of RNase E activity RraA
MDRLDLSPAVIFNLSVLGRVAQIPTIGPAKVAIINDDFGPGIPGLGALMESASAGSFLVTAFQATAPAATFGDIAAAQALKRGLIGLVSDGWIRDVGVLETCGLAVASRGTTPLSGRGRLRLDPTPEVTISDVTIRDGDIVVFDGAGICVVPVEHWMKVREVASKLRESERAARSAIEGGRSFDQATTAHDVL